MQKSLLKKMMNNSNFGYDCRKNFGNCQFVPIYDELKNIIIFSIQKYQNL